MKKINSDFLKIILSLLLFVLSFFFQKYPILYLLTLLFSYIIVSLEIYLHAIQNLKEKEFFDENILMILATIGAFCIGEYKEAVVVMLLFQIGEYLSDMAVHHTKDSITELMDLRSDTIHLLTKKTLETVPTKRAKIGDLFEVRPGEIIPLDGIVIKGESTLDTSSLTGESIPRNIHTKDIVLSGMINLTSVLTIQATSTYETSTASKIIDLMEHSNDKKTHTEKFITKFSKVYTPIIVILAVLITVIPTLFGSSFSDHFYHALVFLVMSCPCALVISVPLGFFQGIGRCSREGILVKGSNELDCLSTIDSIVFDKTGTITEGNFQVTEVNSFHPKNNLLKIAAYCESFSNHPIAKSIVDFYGKKIEKKEVTVLQEESGKGIKAKYQNQIYYLGNERFLTENKIVIHPVNKIGTIIYIATKKEYLGYLVISDQIKENAKSAITQLKRMGISNLMILSGDHEEIVQDISKKVGIDHYYASLLPQDKVNKVKELTKKNRVLFVGDGMNDAPTMKVATLGVAMGGIGSDVTIEASDMVLMKDDLSMIPKAIQISKFTRMIVTYNIGFALVTKGIVLLLALLGFSSIWMAILADVGVTLLSILHTFMIRIKNL